MKQWKALQISHLLNLSVLQAERAVDPCQQLRSADKICPRVLHQEQSTIAERNDARNFEPVTAHVDNLTLRNTKNQYCQTKERHGGNSAML